MDRISVGFVDDGINDYVIGRTKCGTCDDFNDTFDCGIDINLKGGINISFNGCIDGALDGGISRVLTKYV